MDQMEIKSFPTVIIRKFLLFSSPALYNFLVCYDVVRARERERERERQFIFGVVPERIRRNPK